MKVETTNTQIDDETLQRHSIVNIFKGILFVKGTRETANQFAKEFKRAYASTKTNIRAAVLPNPVLGGYKIIVPEEISHISNELTAREALEKAINNMSSKMQPRIDNTTIRIDGGGAWTGQNNYTVFEL